MRDERGTIDEILNDDAFGEIVWRAFRRTSDSSAHRGRPSTGLNRLLRTGVLKHLKNWSFRGVVKELQRNLDYRAFTQVFDEKVASVPTLSRVTRHLDWTDAMIAPALKEELDSMIPRVEQVISQTRARVCRGINNTPNKLLSLFEPKTCVIRKGKPFKPSEFGRLIDIIEVENGFVSDYQVLDGNPSDGSLLIPGLQRHKQRFGRAPHIAATAPGRSTARTCTSTTRAPRGGQTQAARYTPQRRAVAPRRLHRRPSSSAVCRACCGVVFHI